MAHPLAKLGATIDWRFLERQFGAVYSDKPGHPPLPTRLMAGLSILKHTHNLSDEELCGRWAENPYYQLFCGEEFFVHKPPFDRSSLTRWRQRMGEEKLVALIQESLNVGDSMRPKERRDSGQNDLFKARLDQIVDLGHPLAKLAQTIDWRFLEERFGAVYSDKPGQPPLPTRLMAGLSILKHTHDLSDEELCARWVEIYQAPVVNDFLLSVAGSFWL